MGCSLLFVVGQSPDAWLLKARLCVSQGSSQMGGGEGRNERGGEEEEEEEEGVV